MRHRSGWAITAVLLLSALVACAGASNATSPGRVVVAHARFPVALTSDRHGGLLYAERLTGRVRRVTRGGRLEPEDVAQVEVSTAGQRGLLGLATDVGGRVFVAFTAAGKQRPLEVAQVAPSFRLVWSGPASTKLANGGHLVVDSRRRALVLGIGDLQEPAKVADPAAPNGKLLLLDPDGKPNQQPQVLSSGWNNPFSFALTPTGHLWVADNVPGERGERLARGDVAGRPTHVTRLPTDTVPSALAIAGERTLVVCSFAPRRRSGTRSRRDAAVRSPGRGDGSKCRTGLAARNGDLWLASERAIRRLHIG